MKMKINKLNKEQLQKKIWKASQGKEMTNREFAKRGWFLVICDKLVIIPTKRQASKFRMGKGTLANYSLMVTDNTRGGGRNHD